jgi:DNA-binding transcriptional ArsR family regulator
MTQLDLAFGALADSTRRAILVRWARGNATVGELAEPFKLSLPAISRHLKVLEKAALITNERHGKHRFCSLRRDTLSETSEWLDFQRRFWVGSLEKLDRRLRERRARKPS